MFKKNMGKKKMGGTARHERDSNPRSSVYETDALPLGHRANTSGNI